MTTVAIVHHSGFGHTRKQADAVHSGVERDADVSASFILIDAEGNLLVTAWDELLTADAIIFGAPTYMGSVSWQFKKFADASTKPWFGQAWKDKKRHWCYQFRQHGWRQAFHAPLHDHTFHEPKPGGRVDQAQRIHRANHSPRPFISSLVDPLRLIHPTTACPVHGSWAVSAAPIGVARNDAMALSQTKKNPGKRGFFQS